MSLGRWDEATDVIERALQLVPVPLRRSSLWRLSGDIALARGDLAAAAEAIASIRAVVEDVAFKDERQPPLARLEARVAFEELLNRYPCLRLGVDRDALAWTHGDGLVLRGLAALPVVLGPSRQG